MTTNALPLRERKPEAELEDWVSVEAPIISGTTPTPASAPALVEPIVDRITRTQADLKELLAFYKIETSPIQYDRLQEFYDEELESLKDVPFKIYTQDEKVDYLLLKAQLSRARQTLELERARDEEIGPLFEPFAASIKGWIGARMRVEPVDPRDVATEFHGLLDEVTRCKGVAERSGPEKYSKPTGYRAVKRISQLREHLKEMYDFYDGYEPLWDWWVRKPYATLDTALGALASSIEENVVGIGSGDEDTIIGQPIRRDGLLAELKAEMIPYTPEELIRVAEKEYAWCESEMIKASKELGFGKDWHEALEHVKGLTEAPGSQPLFIKSLVDEGTAYVKKHDLVTVPKVAEEAIRMVMIPPSQQKVSPFFLGGPVLYVSYPTSDMSHSDKMMSMRGNNRHFSKATAFHEMIPGHHLQLFVAERSNPHRQVFQTPFYVEGWALYWELLLWSRGDFFTSPEDRVGTLFWRMHRCARIIFSLKFHLGQMTPSECVDLLVNWVGHERANAEGEVRRSFNGDYSPLYQAGYLLGALQIWALRSEAVDQGLMPEKEFHDRILKANMMPIEMVRALLLDQELSQDFESRWKFYGDI
ncbi:hypothetical protein TruAng_003883 [Truncatella angustata]|nr:hypothetical protein TruAng_003883 [Truncatella angustata]